MDYNTLKKEDIEKLEIEQIPEVEEIAPKTFKFTCKLCKNETVKKQQNTKKYWLCPKCTREALLILRWGSKQQMLQLRQSKIKQTNLEKYGVESTVDLKKVRDSLNKTLKNNKESIQSKRKATNLKKYGSFSPMSSPEVIEKRKQNYYEKYGVEDIHKTEEYRNKASTIFKNNSEERHKKARETSLKRYGKECWWDTEENQERKLSSRKEYLEYLKSLNTKKFRIEDHFVVCNSCGGKRDVLDLKENKSNLTCCPCQNGWSWSERELQDFIRSLGLEVIDNNREILDGKELDIYIPSKNIAIEFDGLFWHSDGSLRDYMKYKACQEKGIQLISVWENEWLSNRSLVEKLLKDLLIGPETKIFARKCLVKELDSKTYSDFCRINHIQGYAYAKIKLGLFYGNELVQVMSFGKSRFNKNYEWEIIRECSKQNCKVLGGKSKLYNCFIKNYQPKSVCSYSENRYFTGESYKTLGMSFIKESRPNYYYFKNNTLYSREIFQKHKLPKLLEEFNSNKTEMENMKNNNYRVIYNCGSKLWGVNYE